MDHRWAKLLQSSARPAVRHLMGLTHIGFDDAEFAVPASDSVIPADQFEVPPGWSGKRQLALHLSDEAGHIAPKKTQRATSLAGHGVAGERLDIMSRASDEAKDATQRYSRSHSNAATLLVQTAKTLRGKMGSQ